MTHDTCGFYAGWNVFTNFFYSFILFPILEKQNLFYVLVYNLIILSFFNLFPEVITLPSLAAISFVKMEILLFNLSHDEKVILTVGTCQGQSPPCLVLCP